MLKPNTKRNIFILLNLLCLFLIIFINLSTSQAPSSPQQLQLTLEGNKILNSPHLFFIVILLITYFAIISFGFFNLIYFIIRNFKKPLFAFKTQEKRLLLSQTESSQLIFFVLLSVLFINFFQWLIATFKLQINPIGIAIFSNFFAEAFVIIAVLKYLKAGYLDLKINLARFVEAWKKYLIVLPVLIAIILINNLIFTNLGIKTTINPAIELFLKIKNNFLLCIFVIQIIILGPIAEELFFRGFVYKLFRKKYGFLLSACSSSFLFAALHRSSQDVLPLLALAISLCYIYEKSKNIALPIMFHAIHNGLNVSFLLLLKFFS